MNPRCPTERPATPCPCTAPPTRSAHPAAAALSSSIYVVTALCVLARPEARHDAMIMLSALAIAVIGVGSFAFHGTMLFEWEMLDELPMLMIMATFMLNKWGCHPALMSRGRCVGFGICVLGAFALTVAVYLKLAAYDFFIHAFTAFVLADAALQLTQTSRQPLTMWCMGMCAGCMILGRVAWETEVRFCETDGRVWPLHVLWHGLSALATYYHLLMDTASRIDCGASTYADGPNGHARRSVAIRWALVPYREIRVCWRDRPAAQVGWWHKRE